VELTPTPRWHVEAWAVRDGMAFASLRPTSDVARCERTVFLGVPGLEAVPLGRVAPALWATRVNFQDGLHSEDGDEIGFDSLAEVRELVRRGYLAGGIGPGPGPGGGEGPLPPEPSDGPDAARPVRPDFDRLAGSGRWFRGSRGIADPDTRSQLFATLLEPSPCESTFEHLRVFGAATIRLWVQRLRHAPADDEASADLSEWIQVLWRCGLWSSFRDFEGDVPDAFEWAGPLSLYWRYGFTPGMWPDPAEGFTREQIVFRVPCPLRSDWDPRIRRLSDKLLLAVSTHDYFDQNDELPELMPALLAALAIVSQARPPIVAPTPVAQRERLGLALDWLSEQMPQLRLPITAEYSLRKFAWGELDRR